MRNRWVALTTPINRVRIDDSDWRSLVNIKTFDDVSTQILRVTRHAVTGDLMVRASRASDGKAVNDDEGAEVVYAGTGGLLVAVRRVAESCALDQSIIDQAIAELSEVTPTR